MIGPLVLAGAEAKCFFRGYSLFKLCDGRYALAFESLAFDSYLIGFYSSESELVKAATDKANARRILAPGEIPEPRGKPQARPTKWRSI